MRTNDIVDVFVAYTDKTGGKSRPVLIIKLTDRKAWLLKITSKYSKKSKNIRKYYYPIFDWRKYNLSKPSYTDTKEYLIANIVDLRIERYRGHFSLTDLQGLKNFIDKNNIQE